MLTLFRSSSAWRYIDLIERVNIFTCIKANKILYHCINYAIAPKIELPERDYSANSAVARSNYEITKLSREGKIKYARKLFDGMRDRDVVTWSSVINGYIKCGLIEEARELFDRVDAKKNVVTWTAMVSGYMRLSRIFEAEKVFEEMPERNVVSWNTMIDGYWQNGMIEKALEMFEKMPERNVVSWNIIITALSQCKRIDEARQLFDMMCTRNVISWTSMVTGLARNGRVFEARDVFERMPEKNVVSWNAMINGYAQNLMINEALELFDRMPERNSTSWNTLISGFMQNGDLRRASNLFDKMPQKNVVSWTTLITGYSQAGLSEESLKMFSNMLIYGKIRPNQSTLVSVLGACSDLAFIKEGQQVHQIVNKTIYNDNGYVVSALINMYSKCGDLNTARKMFDDEVNSQKDLVSWNCMIAAYAHHGCGKEAINMFNTMHNIGFKPNDVTYVGLLTACSHSGLVEEGLRFYDELVKDSSVEPRDDHYFCLVDLYCRAGRLKDAVDFISKLETEPSSSSSIWWAVLYACHVHRDLSLGKVAAKAVLDIEPKNSGAYLLLSNIYASTGKRKEAKEVRLKMLEKGLKKQPGCSWIEVGNRFHTFIVSDYKYHSRYKIIYSLISNIHATMKEVEYETNHGWLLDESFLVI